MKQTIFCLLSFCSVLLAQNAPIVNNVNASQRTDGSKIVDIYYDVFDAENDLLLITLNVSDDYGITYYITPADSLLSGDIGYTVMTGIGKHIIWQVGEEEIAFEGNIFHYKVIADDDPCVDYDGNIYQTVQIGDQIWMAENLKVTHYINGDAIPTGYSNSEWTTLVTGAYCVYNDNPANAETYGNLYNWYTVTDTRNIAPDGWHVPTDEEIMELEMTLGMSESQANGISWRGTNEGSKLAGRVDLWINGTLENDAEFGTSGFNFLPGGFRSSSSGDFSSLSDSGYLLSSTENTYSNPWSRRLSFDHAEVYRSSYIKPVGFSVRCVKD